MTRESKVAIILGFAVVLVVAALISDHFSQAREAQFDRSLTAGTPKDFGAGLAQPIGNTGSVAVKEPLSPTPDRTRADGAANTKPPAAPDQIRMGGPDATPPPGPGSSPRDDESRPSPFPRSENSASSEQAIAGTLPLADKPSKPYKVQENDSLYRIAKSEYGDGTLWQELAAFNKSKVGSNNSLRAGTTIVLPPKDVLLGKAQALPEGATPPKKETRVARSDDRSLDDLIKRAEQNRKTDKSPAAKYTTYTVRKGDHLSTISQRLLGSVRRMNEILSLNPGLDDEDSIREGMALKIPKD
ncbi:MAG: LysM peptidoglycan-binding domain-containing protein [Phycisphaerales bacterium]